MSLLSYKTVNFLSLREQFINFLLDFGLVERKAVYGVDFITEIFPSTRRRDIEDILVPPEAPS